MAETIEAVQAPVAVVITCYNLGAYLPEAVDSVLEQTRKPAETIIIDDGSDDPRTLAALDDCARRGLTVVHTPNQGAPLARNLGISRTESPYLLSLDADDVLMPSFLEETVPEIEASPRVGVVGTWIEMFGTAQGYWRAQLSAATDLLWQNRMPGSSLFRRECWEQAGGYKDLKGCQDWELWLSIIVDNGWGWKIVPKVLHRYRQRPGSISEYREAHRPELLRQLVALHKEAYAAHADDLLVLADTESRQAWRELERLTHSMSFVERAFRYQRNKGWRAAVRRAFTYWR